MTLTTIVRESAQWIEEALEQGPPPLAAEEIGVLHSVGRGIARVSGLPGVQAEELLVLPHKIPGLVFNVDPDELGIIVLGEHEDLQAGMEVRRTGKVADIAVGDALLGRVIDAAGRPLDDGGAIDVSERRALEVNAPAIMDRAPVATPLQTGLKAVDALIPIGRGQRELILGDRQTGKTAVALDTIVNQRDKDVVCIYCAIGQRNASVASVIRGLRDHDAMQNSIVLTASCEDAPGLQYIAPYAATTIGEYFMAQGRDVLIVYDDLTKHARAYRELSLLLQRPPGREAYPGDIFYVHSRLLERATHLRDEQGGGSMTALPIIETEAQNISAYIPTNLISITDGQIYLSPDLFRKGQLPAIDVGKSVSRVGGKAQLRAYREVAGDLRLSYSQFEELERFSRFGTRLDDETRQTLQHGRRVREILKQPQYGALSVPEQIVVLLAASEGLLDDVEVSKVPGLEHAMIERLHDEHEEICEKIDQGESLEENDRKTVIDMARTVVGEEGNGQSTADAAADRED